MPHELTNELFFFKANEVLQVTFSCKMLRQKLGLISRWNIYRYVHHPLQWKNKNAEALVALEFPLLPFHALCDKPLSMYGPFIHLCAHVQIATRK